MTDAQPHSNADHALWPTLQQLRLVRYAEGWGHPPAAYLRAWNSARTTGGAGQSGVLKAQSVAGLERKLASVVRLPLVLVKQEPEESSPEVVVKLEPLLRMRPRVQSLLRQTKHHRQWRGHDTLARHDLPSAQPLALLKGSMDLGSSAIPVEMLVLQLVPGKTLLQLVAQQDSGRLTPSLAEQLAAHIRRFSQAGLWNRDPKPSNLIVGPTGELVWLDTVGVGYRRVPDHGFCRHVVKMLLVESRGVGHPCPEDFALELVARAASLASGAARGLLAEIQREANAHTDAAPLDDPLASNS